MFTLNGTEHDVILPEHIVENIISHYNPSTNGTANLLAKMSNTAQLNKKKFLEIIKVIDINLTKYAKQGLIELKWDWDEFAEVCDINLLNLIKKDTHTCADFDHIDFDNLCLYYLEKGYEVCTNCAPERYRNGNNTKHRLYPLKFIKSDRFNTEFIENTKWIINIDSDSEIIHSNQINIKDYTAVWIKWGTSQINNYKFNQFNDKRIKKMDD